MRMSWFVLLVIGITSLFAGCGGTDAEREARLASMTPRERQIQEVLDRRCVKCHTPPDHQKKLDLTHPKFLLPLINSEFLFDDIAVFDMLQNNQQLYRTLMGPDTIAEHKKEEFQLTQEEIDIIRQWVLSERRQDIFRDTTVVAPSTSAREFRRSDG